MALKKTKFNIAEQLQSIEEINSLAGEIESAETESVSKLKDIPAAPAKNYIPPAEYGHTVTKASQKTRKINDNIATIGFKLPKEAKEQYREFFEQFGLNLSEASKNAIEYFIQDIQKGKVRITLTRHFERVED